MAGFNPATVKRSVPSGRRRSIGVPVSLAASNEAVEVPIELIDPYTAPDGGPQPFHLYNEDQMAEMVESIRTNGVLTPVLLRPRSGGRYETLAGHNRIEASRKAGLEAVPAVIRQMDDDEAALAVVDTNLMQRQVILPSERAKAYQLKMEALGNRKGQRSDLSGEERFDAAAVIAADSGESKPTVYRYLRLNKLSPELLDRVDSEAIGVEAGGNLSYLTPDQQGQLVGVMAEHGVRKISAKQSKDIRGAAEQDRLTVKELKEALGCVKEKPVCISLKVDVTNQLTPVEVKAYQKAFMDCKKDPQFIQELLMLLRRYGGGTP